MPSRHLDEPLSQDSASDTRARAMRNVLGNVYLTKNLWYEEREQLDSGGGGALSQGATVQGLAEAFYAV